MSFDQQYVWYASFGSNMNRDRFLCYIRGGSPAGSTRVEVGCRDASLPVAESFFTIPYPLYFAKEAAGWQSMGVAFIGLNQNPVNPTISKKYLITAEQFVDVVKQENNGIDFHLDLSEVKKAGSKVFRHSWYGNLVYLGEEQGYPIFTFTAPWDITETYTRKPSTAYLSTIVNGAKEHYTDEDIFTYFINKPGIKGEYSTEELFDIISNKGDSPC
ncbi:hypothetical protein [Neobacillus dielmonensis]|uniref:hypothetical protein n=1 Tax=Neobacillus dielmonensis TaxID=1347369 RepID=UPI0005A93544|nr:hypothetical protein [Neobacillus dielmonensis]